MKQTSFFQKNVLIFGGALLKPGTNPKRARPLDSKLPIHLVLKATRSTMRTPHLFKPVNDTVASVAKRHGVRVYEYANVGNHLHALIKIRNRAAWSAFIRELTGALARLTQTPWAHRPFTRVVKGWRKAFAIVCNYVRLNELEAAKNLTRAQARAMQKLRRELDPPAA